MDRKNYSVKDDGEGGNVYMVKVFKKDYYKCLSHDEFVKAIGA